MNQLYYSDNLDVIRDHLPDDIDITYNAIGLVKKRLSDQFPGLEFAETGIPRSRENARQLAGNPFQFESWAVSLVGAQPFKSSGGGDSGIDGLLFFKDYEGAHYRIIVDVKSGLYHPKDIRARKQVMARGAVGGAESSQ